VTDPRTLAALLLAGLAAAQPAATSRPASAPATRAARAVQGRLETFQDLRIVRLWGAPAERGYALGRLCAAEIVQLFAAEYGARFARQPRVLRLMRSGIDRLIEYPEDATCWGRWPARGSPCGASAWWAAAC
jgi:hypothetical protein